MPTTRRSARLATLPSAPVDVLEEQTNKKQPATRSKRTTTKTKKATTKAPTKKTTRAKRKTTEAPVEKPAKKQKIEPPAPATKKKSGGSHPVDPDISVKGKSATNYTVVQSSDGIWYDAVLNQCNIGNNNNKYYRLQCLKDSNGSFYAWFRWGRVGEPARSSASTWMGPYYNMSAAQGEFRKKYKSKTGNAFGAATFVPKTGKYTLIEIDNDAEVPDDYKVNPNGAVKEEIEYEPSQLDNKTNELVQVLFSKDMRNEAMASFNLDLRRLPLGVPSQQQINHGVEILGRIEEKLGGDRSITASYQNLSSEFYTAIPHSFGRSRPPVIQTAEDLRSRYDMCNILLDMYSTNETVRRLEKQEAEERVKKTVLPNPVDQHYKSLSADLTLVKPNSREFTVISKYFQETKTRNAQSRILNVWSVNRNKEEERFQEFDDVGNRCLLWHGTNIAVVAPIITSGLRIMPHSGGRVGSGIYLAGMQEKSAQYTSGYGAKFACMFLCEAPLGKQHIVNADGPHASGLKKAPKGFDSVHATGQMQPKNWTSLNIDGHNVKVPQGNCQQNADNASSSFYHDEFLVYNEAQVRLRYVLTVKL